MQKSYKEMSKELTWARYRKGEIKLREYLNGTKEMDDRVSKATRYMKSRKGYKKVMILTGALMLFTGLLFPMFDIMLNVESLLAFSILIFLVVFLMAYQFMIHIELYESKILGIGNNEFHPNIDGKPYKRKYPSEINCPVCNNQGDESSFDQGKYVCWNCDKFFDFDDVESKPDGDGS